MEFADHLKDRFFPDCYVETSTNGNGAHVFLIVDKTDWADADYNAVLRSLTDGSRAVLAETGIELDTVEIKGICATVSWKDGMPKHTAGTARQAAPGVGTVRRASAKSGLHRPSASCAGA